jgi:AcrR family transcriptional regulator
MATKPGRRERKREETRRSIAAAAMRLFLERGFDEVTIAEVAEAADVSVNTVFNHFPTKEDLFFGSHETAEAALTRLSSEREPGEPVIAFLRRKLREGIERHAEESAGRGDHAYWMGVRRVLQGSPALQARAVHRARGEARGAEDALAEALARDAGGGPDDPMPRLVANLTMALYSGVFGQAERRRRAGESPEAVRAALSSAAEAALKLLERGIGDYGAGASGRASPDPTEPRPSGSGSAPGAAPTARSRSRLR